MRPYLVLLWVILFLHAAPNNCENNWHPDGSTGTAKISGTSSTSIHTVLPTECNRYMLWQSLGFYYTFRRVEQPGRFTRLISCSPEDRKNISEEELTLIPSHVSPSYTFNPHNNDGYLPYNKPAVVINWLAENVVEEEYILIVDVDTVLRSPVTPKDYGVRPGYVHAAYFDYLEGTRNSLADQIIPDAALPPEMVGGLYIAHKEDIRAIAPLWLKFTEDVRMHPQAWELTGEPDLQPGDRPWISEMYGYSFAAAHLGIHHAVDGTIMMYPGYFPADPLPKVLHYGLQWNYSTTQEFNKMFHFDFDVLKCPSWEIGKQGLFHQPPHPRTLTSEGEALKRDLLSIEPIATLNAAFCEVHWKRCGWSRQLFWECSKAEKIYNAVKQAWKDIAPET